MKEFLHLFTPVTEALPERGKMVFVINHNGRTTFDKLLKNKNKWQRTAPTHWLDLSKLCTKKEASFECSCSFTNGLYAGRDEIIKKFML